ncbi:MAG: phosphonate C-P lyase system protein PhnL [Pseudomonadota bacterium]|nr:phosphonate C-P lyase system protein PhnL [Pseudomonadota bacterium]
MAHDRNLTVEQAARTGTLLVVSSLSKSFTMHLRGGIVLPVIDGAHFSVAAGRCVVLGGPSGAGKSSILKMAFGNYAADAGQILVRHHGQFVDLVSAPPRKVLEVRRETIGYVSQFLRVVPRVATLDIVAGPLVAWGEAMTTAREKAGDLLARLNLPERLWQLPPSTFSGGEQQRVNIARGFITPHPVLLLDEPTASLDAVNREVVIGMIAEKKRAGTGMLGIFHDEGVREAIADDIVDVTAFAPSGVAA